MALRVKKPPIDSRKSQGRYTRGSSANLARSRAAGPLPTVSKVSSAAPRIRGDRTSSILALGARWASPDSIPLMRRAFPVATTPPPRTMGTDSSRSSSRLSATTAKVTISWACRSTLNVWWRVKDLNLCRLSRQTYSLSQNQ